MARPKKEIDPRQVETLAALFCTIDEIALVLGVHKRTIERRFAALVQAGKSKGKLSIRRAQVEVATKKQNVQMLIWLGKQYLGQKDKQLIETTKPVQEIALKYSLPKPKVTENK